MASSTRKHKRLSVDEMTSWGMFAPFAHPSKNVDNSANLKMAIEMYVLGASCDLIEQKTGVNRQELFYRIKRCKRIMPDGSVVGWRGLTSKHLSTGIARANDFGKLEGQAPTSGCMQALFAKFPVLADSMTRLIVHGLLPGAKHRTDNLSWATIHAQFKASCLNVGIKRGDYPFNSKSQGFSALKKWGNKAKERNEAITQNANEQKRSNDEWNSADALCSNEFYGAVEFDGHWLDVSWEIVLPAMRGDGFMVYEIERLWLLAFIDRASTAVLGYKLAFGANYTENDCIAALQSCFLPWSHRRLSTSRVGYGEHDKMPGLHPELQYIRFNELHLDNHFSHTSGGFLASLRGLAGATPVLGPVGEPNARPRIEMLFGLIEEAGIHQLESTLGSNPRDFRRRKGGPRFRIRYELLADLVDLLVCRWNASWAPGTSQRRIDILLDCVRQSSHIVRRVPLRLRERYTKYNMFGIATIGQERRERISATDRANTSNRRVLRWENLRYYGAGLSAKAEYAGKQVLVAAVDADLREIEAFLLEDSSSIGTLKVEHRFAAAPFNIYQSRSERERVDYKSFQKQSADIMPAIILAVEDQKIDQLKTEVTADDAARELHRMESMLLHVDDPKDEVSVSYEKRSDSLSELIQSLGPTYGQR